MKKIRILFFLLFWAGWGFAQQLNGDSLLKLIRSSPSDTTFVNSCRNLCWQIQSRNLDSAILLGKMGLARAEQISYFRGIAALQRNMSIFYRSKNEISKSKKYLDSASGLSTEKGFKTILADCISDRGLYAYYDGDYEHAFKYLLEGLRLYEELNFKAGISKCYSNLGLAYYTQKDPDKALEYFHKAMSLGKSINRLNDVALCMNNIAIIFLQFKHNSDSTLYYMRGGYQIRKQMNDPRGEVESMVNLGAFFQDIHQIDSAKSYFMKASGVARRLNDYRLMGGAIGSLGYIYQVEKNYAAAHAAFDSSILFLRKSNTKEMLVDAYSSVSDCYIEEKNFEKAMEYYKRSVSLKDSLLTESKSKQIVEMQSKYDSDKKDSEITLLNKDKERQKIVLYFVCGTALLLIFFFGFVWRAYRQKKKANVEISNQKAIIEEKHKEITDSINYAKRIQSAMLTSEEMLRQLFREHFIFFKPKDVVSGDFYWALKTEEGKIIWAAADCTGHGVPGAFMSMIGNSFLNEIVAENKITKPDLILNKLREKVIRTLEQKDGAEQQKDGMDISLCTWDKQKNLLEFAGANNPLYLFRKGKMEEFPADKMPVGSFGGTMLPFTSKIIPLEPGDCIYCFTDGFADQFGGEKGKKFRYSQLEKLLGDIHSLPMPEQQKILLTTFENWKGSLEQVDDILVIGVKI